MLVASELRVGAVIKLEGELFIATGVDHHTSGGQFGSMVFVKARSLKTHGVKELRLHPHDKLEEAELQRQDMEYLYTDGVAFYFMHPETFEQISLPREAIGQYEKFLQPNMRLPVMLHEGSPVSVLLPEFVELKVVTAPPGLREHETATYKSVLLENGMEVLVPQFIKEGDLVKIEAATGKYLERIRREGRKG